MQVKAGSYSIDEQGIDQLFASATETSMVSINANEAGTMLAGISSAVVASKEKDAVVESNKKLSETVKSLSESIKAVCPELFTVVEESKLVEEANSAVSQKDKELAEAKAEVAKLNEEIQGIKATAAKEA
ncbi:hypothetical protein EOM81_12500, partial [bacterium]|nr:hypothetical protein [bacterium]